jgi:hypothetical protein
VQVQFESWRKSPGRERCIPERLWDAAARLCLEHSVHSVSRTLRLNYQDLKEREKHTADRGSRLRSLGALELQILLWSGDLKKIETAPLFRPISAGLKPP